MRILLPVDASPGCRKALQWLMGFLQRDTAEIYLLHLLLSTEDALVHEDEIENARCILRCYENILHNHDFRVSGSDYRLGVPPQAVCQYADEHKIDLIVMGAHGYQGVIEFVMGSFSRLVFKQARQPVMILNNTAQPFLVSSQPLNIPVTQRLERPWNILIPLDGSLAGDRTLNWAMGFLNPKYSHIHLLHIFSYSPVLNQRNPAEKVSSLILEQAKTTIQKQCFEVVASEQLEGSASAKIREYADNHDIDLIIIGSHGEHGPGKCLTGSVSQHVFENANQPVILLNNSLEPSLKASYPEGMALSKAVKEGP